MRGGRIFGAVAAGALLAAAWALPAAAQGVTQARLDDATAEDGNWLTHHGTYAGLRHTGLGGISTANIGGLRPVFTLALRGGAGYSATPVADGGFLYFSDNRGAVTRVDVRDGARGRIDWMTDPGGGMAAAGARNAGVGLWRDQVISVTADGRMLSLDRETGTIAWEVLVAGTEGETISTAPLVIGGTGVVGVAGGAGVRGHLDGVDLATGGLAWRTHTAGGNDDDPNEIARVTWLDAGESWRTGGGAITETGTYDPERGLMYWGTGHPEPAFDPEARPGDNLYASSVLALGPEDGAIRWFFQYTPNDPFAYSETGAHPLMDADGRALVAHAAENGHVYAFDRGTGEYLYGVRYADDVIWTDGIDPGTGLPRSYDAYSGLQGYGGTAPRRGGVPRLECPPAGGGEATQHVAGDPARVVLFVSAGSGCDLVSTSGAAGVSEDAPIAEAVAERGLAGAVSARAGYGILAALDARTGATLARIETAVPNRGGLLSSAGGWIMAAYLDGDVIAYDATTLAEIWRFSVGAPIAAPPMSYAVDGRQYIAILVGGSVSDADRQRWPDVARLQPAAALYVFGLETP